MRPRPLQFLRRHPSAVLGAAVLAFVAWIGQDAFEFARPVFNQVPDGVVLIEMRQVPPDFERFKFTPQGTAQALPKLKPGMTRTEVEGLVGTPASGDIHPAMVAGGKITYHMAYEADLEPLATVRPIRHTKVIGPAPARTLVTLEFDATQPGHPLVEVHYPDPLF